MLKWSRLLVGLPLALVVILWIAAPWSEPRPPEPSADAPDRAVAGAPLRGTIVRHASPPLPQQAPPAIAVNTPADSEPHDPQAAMLARARSIEERTTAPNTDGEFNVFRLIEVADMKFPLLRVEEHWRQDPQSGVPSLADRHIMAADHLAAQVRPGVSDEEVRAYVGAFGGSVRERLLGGLGYRIATPSVSLDAFTATLEHLSDAASPFVFAEPDYVVHATFFPDDPSFPLQWGLFNYGQTEGTANADIDALGAWELSRGNHAIVVAVIDTGIDHTHPDLAANMWHNPGEISGNGLDDDGNGYTDDFHGWNFYRNNNNTMDPHGHGSHCAGIIGAVTNNALGIAGVSPKVQLMALTILGPDGGGFTLDAVEAIRYATRNGARVISASWGGGGYSSWLHSQITEAAEAGVVFVASAGNSSRSNDITPHFPSTFQIPNIISVAATDHNDKRASFSNWGARTVHLAAPGVAILSTVPNEGYLFASGTSMAAPHVAGAAALLLAERPDWTWPEVKEALMEGADRMPNLTGLVVASGRLNAAQALYRNVGQHISIATIRISDSPADGAIGNGDGILSPGEQVAMSVDVRNRGTDPAMQVRTDLEIIDETGQVTLSHASISWGNIAGDTTVSQQGPPILLQLAADLPTPHAFAVRFTSTAADGGTWVAKVPLVAYTVSAVSGQVTRLADGSPISNATVTFAGPVHKAARTDSLGTYQISLIDGTYSVEASATGFNTSEPEVTIQTPPHRPGLDFALGAARLVVEPQHIAATQPEDHRTTQTLTLSNAGDHPLRVAILTESALATAAAPVPMDPWSPATSTDQAFANQAESALPFEEGFESGTFDGWTFEHGNAIRQITTEHAAEGERSFHLDYPGPPRYRSGILRSFPPETRPQYIAFWLRLGQADASAGHFIVPVYGPYHAIWFSAGNDGYFRINAGSTGDKSVRYFPGVWYRIELRNIDWDLGRFDYHVNGRLIRADIRFINPVSSLRAIYISNYDRSESWWDGISILEHNARWLNYEPAEIELAPGASVPVGVTLDSHDIAPGTVTATLRLITNDPVQPQVMVPVELTVTEHPNTPPVALPATVEMDEDHSAGFALEGHDADGDPFTAVIMTLPEVGTLYQTEDGVTPSKPVLSAPAAVTDRERRLVYVPPPNRHGDPLATFDFIIVDHRSHSEPATVTLRVHWVNDLPVARDDRVSAPPGRVIERIDVLANDTDVDGDLLQVIAFTQGARGQVSQNTDGTLRYVPDPDFIGGFDDFTYEITDPHGATASARVRVVIGDYAGGDWPMMGREHAVTGYYPARLGSEPLVPSWSRLLAAELPQVAIVTGRVYATPISGTLFLTAIDLASGLDIWRTPIETDSIIPRLSGPSFGSNRIAVNGGGPTSAQSLWIFDAVTGDLVWTQPFQTQNSAFGAATITDNAVYITGGTFGGILGFDLETGAELFFRYIADNVSITHSVADGVVYSAIRGVLYATEAESGEALWSLKADPNTTGGTTSTPAIATGRAYFIDKTNQNTELVCVDLTSRQVSWKAAASGLKGSPAVANGIVYALRWGEVLAYDAITGALVRAYPTGTTFALNHQPIVTDDAVIAASDDRVWIWDLATGSVRQILTPGGLISMADGYLLIAGKQGTLYCHGVEGPGRRVPVALDMTADGIEDQVLPISMQGHDSEESTISAIITALPTVGHLFQTHDGVTAAEPITSVPTGVTHPQRIVIYRPLPDDFGTARSQFEFTVHNAAFVSNAATVTINLAPVNDPPVAQDSRFHLYPREPLPVFDPTTNDIDVDGDPLTIIAFTQPLRGVVVQNPDGTLGYTPGPDFLDGEDVFTYTVADPDGETSSATVTMIVANRMRMDWPTLGRDPAHTGHYPGNLGREPLTVRWSTPLNRQINTPVVADGRLFYTTYGGSGQPVYAAAIQIDSGAEAWRTPELTGSTLPPTWYDGRLYFTRATNQHGAQFVGLNAASGQLLFEAAWNVQNSRYLAPVADDDGVYVPGAFFNGLYRYDRLTGEQYFNVRLPSASDWTSALTQDALYTFIRGDLFAHDRITGEVLATRSWWSNASSSIHATMVCADGVGYLLNQHISSSWIRDVIAVNLDDLSVRWEIRGQFSGTPVIAHGILHVIAGTRIDSFVASTGRFLGSFTPPADAATITSLALTHDLLAATTAARTYLFDLRTRALLQTLSRGGHAVFADDSLFIVGADHVLHRYSRKPPQNTAPRIDSLRVEILERSALAVALEATDADGDPLSFVIRSLPTHGKLFQTLDGENPGEPITAVPAIVTHPSATVYYEAPQYLFGIGADKFTVTAHDHLAASNVATVIFDIININDPPTARPATVTLRPDQYGTGFRPEINDLDPDGDPLRVIGFTQPAHGALVQLHDGSLAYQPDPHSTATEDLFEYTVADPDGLTSTSTVRIILTGERIPDWPMFGGDTDHSGFLPIFLGEAMFTELWTHDLGKTPHPVAVADGRVFASTAVILETRWLVALDANTGAESWRATYASPSPFNLNPPAHHRGRVFVQVGDSSNRRLKAYDARDGTLLWTSPYAAQSGLFLAPTVDDTGVYVNGGTFGGIYRYDPESGEQIYFRALEQFNHWTPLRHAGETYSFVQGQLRRHNNDTGVPLASLDLGGSWTDYAMKRTPAAANGTAFVVVPRGPMFSTESELVAVDLESMTILWSKELAGLHGTPAIADGTVYVLGHAAVHAFAAADGSPIRSYPVAGEASLGLYPMVTYDRVIVASPSSTHVFDRITGAPRQQIPHGGHLSLARHVLYIASADGMIRAYSVPPASNARPIAHPQSLQTLEDQMVEITLSGTDPDGDALTATLTSLPAEGVLIPVISGPFPAFPITQIPAQLGTVPLKLQYYPPQDAHGDHLGDFTFQVSDGNFASQPAVVQIHVTPVNDPPVAMPDLRRIEPGQILSPVWEMANDRDVDGDPLTRVSFTQPALGILVENADGTLRYHPPRNVDSAVDTFTYTIADPDGLQSTATVTIEIGPPADGHWPTQGGNIRRSGFAQTTLGDGPLRPDWSRHVGEQAGAVVVGDGLVIASARPPSGPVLLAFDESTGMPVWQRSFDPAFSISPPSLDQGISYVQRANAESDSQVWALSAASGIPLWNHPVAARWNRFSAPLVSQSTVYVPGGPNGGLYGLHSESGAQRFFRTLAPMDGWTPSATLGGSVASFVRGVFTLHHPHDGAPEWTIDLGWKGVGNSMNRMSTIEGSRAFFVHDGDGVLQGRRDLIALDLLQRKLVWRRSGLFRGTPAVANGRVHVLTGNTITAFDAASGRSLQAFIAPAADELVGQPLVTEDLVIASSAQNTFLFRRRDQELVQILPLGGALSLGHDRLILTNAIAGNVSTFVPRPPMHFLPPGGAFTGPVQVAMGSATPGARVHYTLDGSPPDFASLSVPAGSLVDVAMSLHLRAILVDGSSVSPITNASFTMEDLDGDGIPDWWEWQTHGNLTAAHATSDSDGNGMSDRDELIAGTNPFDPEDHFRISAVEHSDQNITLSWPSKADRFYVVESSADMTNWAASEPLIGSGGTLSYSVATDDHRQVHVRVRVLPLLLPFGT